MHLIPRCYCVPSGRSGIAPDNNLCLKLNLSKDQNYTKNLIFDDNNLAVSD